MTNARQLAAAGLAATAIGFAVMSNRNDQPTPLPDPPAGLNLRGVFVGPTAADDCLIFGHLCESLAEMIEWDGKQDQPRLTTGAAIDDLRRLAREFRLDGSSVGSRQPRAADEIGNYMTEKLGTDGGPITTEQRAAWVNTFREIARACDHAIKL